jgi:molybdenum cofactor synthesis domain-containing protein
MTDAVKSMGGAGAGQARAGFEQSQFLDVIDRDEAERRFRAVLDLEPIGEELVPLADALGRTLAHDIAAPVDVPGFDRSNVDGYAVRAEDTFGATEERPRRLRINSEIIATGVVPNGEVLPSTGTVIATGGMLPRGADAVVMVEHTRVEKDELAVVRPVVPGAAVTFAGSDIGRGEVVLRRGELLSSRETGVLAALGIDRVPVHARPKVAILSTGDELVAPGAPARPGLVYDSNATILADAVRELGGEPVRFGIVPDDEARLDEVLRAALRCDVVLLSGGTSKGGGDLSYRAVGRLAPPGIVAHGVALKPGKSCRHCAYAGRAADSGRDPARISDFGDLHLPRVCGTGHSRAGGAPGGDGRHGERSPADAGELRARAHRVPAGGTGGRARWSRGVSNGEGVRIGHRVQPGGRVRRDPAQRRTD